MIKDGETKHAEDKKEGPKEQEDVKEDRRQEPPNPHAPSDDNEVRFGSQGHTHLRMLRCDCLVVLSFRLHWVVEDHGLRHKIVHRGLDPDSR